VEGSSRRGIVTGGTWCVDRNKLVDRWPSEDELAVILSEESRGGGSACNLAVDIRKLDPGMPVETIGLVGADADGEFLLAEADAHGIDRRQMAMTRDARTNYTDAFASKRTGRRTHIYNPGTSDLLTPDHFDFAATRGRILHLGLPGVHRLMDEPWQGWANGWVCVLEKARSMGLETNLELCSQPPERIVELVRPCLPYLDLLIVNDSEFAALGGEPTAQDGRVSIEACVRAGRRILAQGAMSIVVVHFPAGGVAISREGEVAARPSVRVPPGEIRGANGAGDAFAAGFVYGHHEGWSVARSLELAHASAASSLRGVSTTATVETWQSCLALAARWGTREAI
jgi:sugar/nucleoside kinase (ribokinase family)